MANKRLAQHWLKDDASLKLIIDFAELAPHDTVLEIGPGQGDLTRRLLDKSSSVIAVEVDEALVEKLVQTLPAGNLFIVHQDIRQFDFGRLPAGYKVVANIPYNITADIIKTLLSCSNRPSSATLLVQKEVAERISANPGNMSVLAISVQLYADATLGPVIKAANFDPIPKVDSQVVKITVSRQPKFEVDEKKFFKLVKAGFSEKRKKLKSALAGGLNQDKKEVEELLKSVGIDASFRAQMLSLEQWYNLYNKIYN